MKHHRRRAGWRSQGRAARLFVVVAALLGGGTAMSASAQIRPADDAPRPLSPEESARRFQVPAGFRIELVASEPQLADPVALAFDAEGRMLVCEIHGYNLEGHYDVLELNKTGVLDKQIRRIPASSEALAKAEKETYGTVKLLEDLDGDGRTDRTSVWADRLPPCYGLVAALGGVLVVCAPDIYFLADRDGDGRAEIRQKLFSGFGVGELWTRISNPCWDVDNWIYVACGAASGGTISGPRLPAPVELGNTGFRLKPDGSALEPITGGTSGFGLAISDWGDRFLVTNQQHALFVAPLPYPYLARNPYYAAPDPIRNICTYGHPAQVYPTSQPDPWRVARARDPAWVQFYGPNETTNGLVTSACAPLLYRADHFPPPYRDNHFFCEPAQNLIHRCLVEPNGAGFLARRATDNVEFLTSTEQWFRPVNLAVGPEGALYIVDMYREIIEDYSAIPRYLQQQYGLIRGDDRGRIWRIVAEGVPLPGRVNLRARPSAELVGELEGGNAWRRLTAQRLLVERGDLTVVPQLRQLAIAGGTPQGRLHALYTLAGLESVTPDILRSVLADSHYGPRLHALRLAEPYLDNSPEIADRVLDMLDDPHPQVRLQVAFTVGQFRDERSVPALARLAIREGDDEWMRAAILSSAGESPHRLAMVLLGQASLPLSGGKLLEPLAAVIGSRRQPNEIADFLIALTGQSSPLPEEWLASCLSALSAALERGTSPPLVSAEARTALSRLLRTDSPRLQLPALKLAKLLQLEQTPEILAAFENAAETALDEDQELEARKTAVEFLTSAPGSLLLPTLQSLLDARQPVELQLRAVAGLSGSEDEQAASILLADWKSLTPQVRSAVLDALFRRLDRLPRLLDALENGTVPAQVLDPLQRAQLTAAPRAEISSRAQSLFAGLAANVSQEVVDRYQEALAAPRDAERGHAVYQKHCSPCHRLQGQGYEVGPDLATAKTRADETLLLDMLDPSGQVTAGYSSYMVITDSGRAFTGILAAESATGVTLRWQEGATETILRNEIDVMKATDLSLMPADFQTQVTPQDVADLIAYLRAALGPAAPPGHVLFDDEPTFVERLDEGTGTARLVMGDRFSGAAALCISPPQKFSASIAGWDYSIREHPGENEYRYLRFAWKARGDGIMLELAAAGGWAPAEQPFGRYYSGRNTTGWQAHEISALPPREWTEVVVDLWQDCGSFQLTGIAPTAIGGDALFDRFELLRSPGP